MPAIRGGVPVAGNEEFVALDHHASLCGRERISRQHDILGEISPRLVTRNLPARDADRDGRRGVVIAQRGFPRQRERDITADRADPERAAFADPAPRTGSSRVVFGLLPSFRGPHHRYARRLQVELLEPCRNRPSAAAGRF